MTASFRHQPVMVDQVADLMAAVPPGVMVDATVGAGGHAKAVLDRHDGLDLIGIDRDTHAIEASTETLAPYGDRVTLRHARFDALADTVHELGHTEVSGVLFDLGVSSHHLDDAGRGFSFRHDGPLDMRMDPTQSRTASDVVNGYSADELTSILSEHSDERFARRVARAIVAARPLTTTGELADVVRDAIPAAARRRGGHPARRSFQAIRIEVNDELEPLPDALDQAVELLAPGGRGAVLAYHSGEDRITKDRFRAAATAPCICGPLAPCTCGAEPAVKLLTRRPTRPDAEEVERNPRAASARLRAVEKLPQDRS